MTRLTVGTAIYWIGVAWASLAVALILLSYADLWVSGQAGVLLQLAGRWHPALILLLILPGAVLLAAGRRLGRR